MGIQLVIMSIENLKAVFKIFRRRFQTNNKLHDDSEGSNSELEIDCLADSE